MACTGLWSCIIKQTTQKPSKFILISIFPHNADSSLSTMIPLHIVVLCATISFLLFKNPSSIGNKEQEENVIFKCLLTYSQSVCAKKQKIKKGKRKKRKIKKKTFFIQLSQNVSNFQKFYGEFCKIHLFPASIWNSPNPVIPMKYSTNNERLL